MEHKAHVKKLKIKLKNPPLANKWPPVFTKEDQLFFF